METQKLILVIDDEPDFAETIRFFLENSNFRVATASGGEEGIEKAGLKPDLILLDLNMPQMNGHEVCRRLKEDETTKYIPIIMLTALETTLDKVEALELGVTDYIGKNFPLEEILARIKAALRDPSSMIDSQTTQEKNKKVLELREIIDKQKLRILFQPIVSLGTRQPIGYEALTRGPKKSFFENPINLFTLATEVNMLFELDFICRSLSAKKASFLNSNHLLFLNTDPSVITTNYLKS